MAFKIGIDVGGTFTDFLLMGPTGRTAVHKELSTPADPSIAELGAAGFAPMEGFPRDGAHGRVAFFEPDAVTGLLFEVCQPDAPKRDGGAD